MNKEAKILYTAFHKLTLTKSYDIADICYYLFMYMRKDITLLCCKGNIDMIFKNILEEEIEERRQKNNE